MMAKLRKSFMEEMFSYNSRRARGVNPQHLMNELKEELFGNEQRMKARAGMFFFYH